jgi:hypothetical protein
MPTIFLANGLVTEVQIAQIGWKQPILDISPNNLNGLATATDYGRLGRKLRSLHGWKSTPIPKFLGTAEAYFVCHIDPNYQISLIYASIGCP